MFGFVMSSGGLGPRDRRRHVSKSSRREFLGLVKASAPAVVLAMSASENNAAMQTVVKTDDEWREQLSPLAYYVLREHGTERSHTSPLDKVYSKGIYKCKGCDSVLFTSESKFNSGTGWPSFYDCENTVVRKPAVQDFLFGGTEVRCGTCDGHLGHVFKDGPRPTGLRYCINGVALEFIAEEEKS